MMAASLLFIHGTGVRRAGYEETLSKIKIGLKDAGRDDVDVSGFLWGETFGCRIDDEAVTSVLPTAPVMDIAGENSWEAALWDRLLEDPLFELRMAAIRPGGTASAGAPLPGAVLPDVQVSQRVASLGSRLHDPLPGGIAASVIAACASNIAATPALRGAALAAANTTDPDLNQAMARAIVACALVRSRTGVSEGPDALYVIDDRRRLVDAVAALLFPTAGLGGWLFDKIKGAAEAWGTKYGRDRRDNLMAGAGPGAGDILLYQRRGDAVLDAIESQIVDLVGRGTPVVVLGHSLGGIMLVDLLSRPRGAGPLPIDRLITVGSQSPALYECDALGTIRLGQPLAHGSPFVPWLNFFDRNDFLSFCASRCFPDRPAGIEDFEIMSGVAFPEAHSAYFRQKRFYEKLAGYIP